MTKSEEEGLLTIVTTFVSEIYFSMWFLESSCVDDSEYVPNLPAAMNIFFTTSVQSENLTFLGVRSTNPLPAASGLVKLTREEHAGGDEYEGDGEGKDEVCQVLAWGGTDGGVRRPHGDQHHWGHKQGLHPEGVQGVEGWWVKECFPLSLSWMAR